MAKKMFSFPLDLYEDDAVTSLNLCQSALFRLLIEYYWKTGREVPNNSYAIGRLCNADYRTMKRYGKRVIEVVAIMMPKFVEARELKKRNRTTFQNNAVNIRAKLKIKRQANKVVFVDEELQHDQITPVSPVLGANWLNEGMFDKNERAAAVKAKKNYDGKTFTD